MAKSKQPKVGGTCTLKGDDGVKMTITRIFNGTGDNVDKIEYVEAVWFTSLDELRKEKLPKDAILVLS